MGPVASGIFIDSVSRSPESGRIPVHAADRTPGNDRGAAQELGREDPRARRVVAGEPEMDGRDRDAARLETEIRGERVTETPDEKPGAGEEQQAQRDLARHERRRSTRDDARREAVRPSKPG